MKKIIPFIAILVLLLSCEKKEDNPYDFNFVDEGYCHYYVFMYGSMVGSDCWGYDAISISGDIPYYYEREFSMEVKKLKDSEEIQIFHNGELFLTGTNLTETEKYFEFEIEKQTTTFNTLTTNVYGGYDGECETYFDGRIYKDRGTEYALEINFRFIDEYKGQENTWIMVSI
jgi:hypothetical protein